MNLKQKAAWSKVNQVLSEIDLHNCYLLKNLAFHLAAMPYKTVVLCTFDVTDIKTGKQAMVYNACLLNKKHLQQSELFLAKQIHDLLQDTLDHELGEFFTFRGQKTFDQHEKDSRFRGRTRDKRRRYQHWIAVAEAQKTEMSNEVHS